MARSTSLGELLFKLLLSQAEFQSNAPAQLIKYNMFILLCNPLNPGQQLLANSKINLAVSVSMLSIAIMGVSLCPVILPQSPILNHRKLSSIQYPVPRSRHTIDELQLATNQIQFLSKIICPRATSVS